MNCKYCNKEITKKDNVPIKLSLEAHVKKCKSYYKYRQQLLDCLNVEDVYNFYLDGHSLSSTAKKFSVSTKHMGRFFSENNLKLRTKQERYNLPERTEAISNKKQNYSKDKRKEIQDKRITTTKDKYGVDNVFQADSIKAKTKETCIEKFGVESPMSSPEILAKSKSTCIKNHGVDNIFKSEEFKKNLPDILEKKYGVRHVYQLTNASSSIQANTLFDTVYNMLSDSIKAEIHYANNRKREFGKRDNSSGNYYFYDFVLSKSKKIVEYNGDYWHANPDKYQPKDMIRKEKVWKIWEKDAKKIKLVEDLGFEVLVVWEKDYLENQEKVIENVYNFVKE